MNRLTAFHLFIFTALIISTVPALKTPEIQFGRDGLYDGEAWIRREADGRLLFTDATLTSPVALSAMAGAPPAHGDLPGLAADDHAHYLTAPRHLAAHSPAANAALPIPADVNANATLGAHTADAAIHLNRGADEFVAGAWRFTARPEFHDGLVIGGPAPASARARFTAESLDGEIFFQDSPRAFAFSDPIVAPSAALPALSAQTVSVAGSLSGGAAGQISQFASIEGIAPAHLLDRTADEDVAGQWDFLNRVSLAHADDSTQGAVDALNVTFHGEVYSTSPLASRTRAAIVSEAALANKGAGALEGSAVAGVRAAAGVSRDFSTADDVAAFGVFAQGGASDAAPGARAVGVAGVAEASPGGNAIGVLGALAPALWGQPSQIPAGQWAGWFDGDVGVSGALTVGGAPVLAAPPNVRTVSATGAAAYATIQAAVDAAADGDTVAVFPGEYAETVTIAGKNLSLVGLGPREAVVITRQNAVAVLSFGGATVNINPTANKTVRLANLTIRNTGTGDAAVAVLAGDTTASSNERVRIDNCHISSGCRDALAVWRTDFHIRDSRIENAPGNAHTFWGAFDETVAVVERCVLYTEDPHDVIQLADNGNYTFRFNYYEDDDDIDVVDSATVTRTADWVGSSMVLSSDGFSVFGDFEVQGETNFGELSHMQGDAFFYYVGSGLEKRMLWSSTSGRLHFSTDDGASWATDLYSDTDNELKTDDAFSAASFKTGTNERISSAGKGQFAGLNLTGLSANSDAPYVLWWDNSTGEVYYETPDFQPACPFVLVNGEVRGEIIMQGAGGLNEVAGVLPLGELAGAVEIRIANAIDKGGDFLNHVELLRERRGPGGAMTLERVEAALPAELRARDDRYLELKIGEETAFEARLEAGRYWLRAVGFYQHGEAAFSPERLERLRGQYREAFGER